LLWFLHAFSSVLTRSVYRFTVVRFRIAPHPTPATLHAVYTCRLFLLPFVIHWFLHFAVGSLYWFVPHTRHDVGCYTRTYMHTTPPHTRGWRLLHTYRPGLLVCLPATVTTFTRPAPFYGLPTTTPTYPTPYGSPYHPLHTLRGLFPFHTAPFVTHTPHCPFTRAPTVYLHGCGFILRWFLPRSSCLLHSLYHTSFVVGPHVWLRYIWVGSRVRLPLVCGWLRLVVAVGSFVPTDGCCYGWIPGSFGTVPHPHSNVWLVTGYGWLTRCCQLPHLTHYHLYSPVAAPPALPFTRTYAAVTSHTPSSPRPVTAPRTVWYALHCTHTPIWLPHTFAFTGCSLPYALLQRSYPPPHVLPLFTRVLCHWFGCLV